MDDKFNYCYELICLKCESDEIYSIGESKYSGDIVKCSNCGAVMVESDLKEKKEEENE